MTVKITSDRRRNAYLDATALSQDMLDETFLGGENQIEAVGVLTKTVGETTYTLRFATFPKYVGDNYYEGRATFPQVQRTLGELQAPTLQFSQFEVVLDNQDGFYNAYLPEGADYFSPIGARLVISIGLRDVASSYITVFDGFVPEQDGFEVDRQTITIRATDKFNDLNRRSPLPFVTEDDFPDAPTDVLGKIIPFVLGDWEAGFDVADDAGTISVNDGMANVNVKTARAGNFYGGVVGYFVGGGFFVFSIGTYTPDAITACYIRRGENLMQVDFNATPQNTAGYWSVEVTALQVDPSGTTAYQYQTGDVAVIAVKVPYDTGKYSNAIEIAEQMLFTLAGKSSGDLDTAAWDALKAKSTPAPSDMTTLKARKWIGEEKDSVLDLVLSSLEEVRVEMWVNLAGLITLSTLHPEDFPAPAAAAARIDALEIDEETLKVSADERTFFNQANLNYAFTPVTKRTMLATSQFKNQTSIDKSGKRVIKTIDAPSLYVEADAVNQLKEFLRFYSTGLMFVKATVSWIHLRRDLAEFVAFNYDTGSVSYSEAPMMTRELSIDLLTAAVTFRLLSLANFSYAGYSPANASRFLSGADASITMA